MSEIRCVKRGWFEMVLQTSAETGRQLARRWRPSNAVASGWSQVEDQVVAWLRAADQCAAVGGVIDRGGGVADRSGYDGCLAGMAHPGAARPAHRHVAGFGELEQAGVAGVPARVQVAARERDQGSGAWLAGGRVRSAGGRGRDAGCYRGPGTEDLGTDSGSLDAGRGQ